MGPISRWAHTRDPGQAVGRILFFRTIWHAANIALTLLYRQRALHRDRVPKEGPLLVVANHQSFLDPPIIGTAIPSRNIVPLARSGLFKNPLFGALIKGLNSISIRQGETDAGAMRAALGELKNGRMVLIFPEGSRTEDGDMQPLQRGAWVLMTRSRATVLPVALDGAFDTWPRKRKLPRLFGCRVAASIGHPIPPDELRAMGPDEGLAEISRRLKALQMEARGLLRASSSGRFPARGPADDPSPTQGDPRPPTAGS